MKGKHISTRLFFLVFVVSLFVMSFGSAHGQTSRMISAARRLETANRQANEYERDEMGRETNRKSDPTKSSRTTKVRAEIEEDLKGLQSSYNEVVTALQSKGDVSDAFAKESALSIKKYADRLRVNLSLPATDEKEKNTADTLPVGRRPALSRLCRHIYEFITNPIFETTTGMNVEQSIKARQSLDTIIVLAEKIGDQK